MYGVSVERRSSRPDSAEHQVLAFRLARLIREGGPAEATSFFTSNAASIADVVEDWLDRVGKMGPYADRPAAPGTAVAAQAANARRARPTAANKTQREEAATTRRTTLARAREERQAKLRQLAAEEARREAEQAASASSS